MRNKDVTINNIDNEVILTSNDRLFYLDVVRGIGILLIVLGHISTEKNIIVRYAYSFNVALFFIVTGYLLKFKNKNIYIKDQLKNKFTTLIIPYYFFSLFFILTNIFINGLNIKNMVSEIAQILMFIPSNALWFLPALFFAEVFFTIWRKIKMNIIKITMFISFFTIPYLIGFINYNFILLVLGRAMVGTGFIIMGYISFNIINTKNIKKYIPIFLILITFIISFILNGVDFDLYSLSFGNLFLYFFNGVIASISIIAIIKEVKVNKILEFYGKNSMIIMCTHQCFLMILDKFYNYRDSDFVSQLGIFFIIILIEHLIINIINKYCIWPIGEKVKN